MSIVTKTGDKGKTSLYRGGRVSKDDPRVEAYGTLDELCSFLGLARSLLKDIKTKKLIESIQRDLFVAGAEIASRNAFLKKLESRINNAQVLRVERAIKEIERKHVFKECCFYLPGEDFVSGIFDAARTIARRAERRAVTLKRKNILRNPHILIFLNRLSDLLYLLARENEKKHRKVK